MVPQDPKEAAAWYQKSADSGEAMAEFSLGNAYLNAEGVSVDYQQAYKCYTLAASQMRTEGYVGLAKLFHDGLRRLHDDHQALFYALQAEEKGLTGGNSIWRKDDPRSAKAAACRLISEIYSRGQGVTPDPVAARHYLHKAALYGDKDGTQATIAAAHR